MQKPSRALATPTESPRVQRVSPQQQPPPRNTPPPPPHPNKTAPHKKTPLNTHNSLPRIKPPNNTSKCHETPAAPPQPQNALPSSPAQAASQSTPRPSSRNTHNSPAHTPSPSAPARSCIRTPRSPARARSLCWVRALWCLSGRGLGLPR